MPRITKPAVSQQDAAPRLVLLYNRNMQSKRRAGRTQLRQLDSIEQRPYLVFLHHLPAARGRGVGGHALKHHVGGAI